VIPRSVDSIVRAPKRDRVVRARDRSLRRLCRAFTRCVPRARHVVRPARRLFQTARHVFRTTRRSLGIAPQRVRTFDRSFPRYRERVGSWRPTRTHPRRRGTSMRHAVGCAAELSYGPPV